MVRSLLALQVAAEERGDAAEASRFQAERRTIYHLFRDPAEIATQLQTMARTLYSESLELCEQHGDAANVARCRDGLAQLAAACGQPD